MQSNQGRNQGGTSFSVEHNGDAGWGRGREPRRRDAKVEANAAGQRAAVTIESRSRGMRYTSRGWVAVLLAALALLGCGSAVDPAGMGGNGEGGAPPEECATCYQGTPCGDYRTCREVNLANGEDIQECADRTPEGFAEWSEIEACEAGQ